MTFGNGGGSPGFKARTRLTPAFVVGMFNCLPAWFSPQFGDPMRWPGLLGMVAELLNSLKRVVGLKVASRIF
jgi:hypothetical protein